MSKKLRRRSAKNTIFTCLRFGVDKGHSENNAAHVGGGVSLFCLFFTVITAHNDNNTQKPEENGVIISLISSVIWITID